MFFAHIRGGTYLKARNQHVRNEAHREKISRKRNWRVERKRSPGTHVFGVSVDLRHKYKRTLNHWQFLYNVGMNHKIITFVIAEATRAKRGKESPMPQLRSAPHYLEQTVPSQYILKSQDAEIDGRPVRVNIKTYHPDAVLVEGVMEVADIFSADTLELKDKLLRLCYDVAKKHDAKEHPAEEYNIYQISGYDVDPDVFVEKRGEQIAGLLKSEKISLDDKEVEYTLSSQLKYSKNDLVIIDWDGAFVFDPDGNIDEALEIFEIANYQLLRYRIFDHDLDGRLKKIVKLSQTERKPQKLFSLSNTKEVEKEFRELINLRSESITHFEAMERDIKLIGEWYSARLYELISKKFRLEEWRRTIKDKLDSIEDAYSITSENLGFSRNLRLEFVQIWLFFLLQIGWFVLIILELYQLIEK